MARQGTSNFNRYTDWEFPEYEYQEYPKIVYPGSPDPSKPLYVNGKPSEGVTVNSEAEEATALAGEDIVREEDERAELHAQAEARGMKFDKRWSPDRLRDAIDAHDVAMDAAQKAAAQHRAQA